MADRSSSDLNGTSTAVLAAEGFSAIKAATSVLHAFTLLSLCFYAYTMYRRVRIDHPVFRLIFQELVALCVLEAATYVSLLFLMASNFDSWFKISSFAAYVGNQIHQMTWLFITCIRYYLLCLKAQDDVDLDKLRKRCQVGLWLPLVGLNLLGVTQILILRKRWGHPKIDYLDLNPAAQFATLLQMQALMNLPDVMSIFVYLAMLRHFRKLQTASVEPAAESIEMGVFPAGVSPSSSFDSGSLFGEGGPASSSSSADENPEQEHSHEIASVVRTLGMHALFCLLDLAFVLQALVPDPDAKACLFMATNTVVSFWVPMLIIKRNFKVMDNMAENCIATFC